jgi:hypothetical protein
MTTPNLPPINFGKDDVSGYTPKVFGTSENFNFDNPFDPANFDTEKLGLGLGAISTLDGASALSTGGQENGVRSQTFAYMNYLRSLCLAPYNVEQLYNASNYVFDSTNGDIYCSLVDSNIGNALTDTSKWTNTNINIANLYTPATETVAGVIKISTSSQATEGDDDETAMTPAKLFSLFSSASLSANSGYFKIPFMIAGARANVIIQFGTDFTSNTVQNIIFPIVFPTACCAVVATIVDSNAVSVSTFAMTTTGFTAYKSRAVGFRYIALGYELI